MEYNHRSKLIPPWEGTGRCPVPDLQPNVYFPTLEKTKYHASIMKAMDLSARVEDLWAALDTQLDEDLVDLMLQCRQVGKGLAQAHEVIMAIVMVLNYENWSTQIVVPNAQGSKFSYRLRPFASGGQFHLATYQYQPRKSVTFVVPSLTHIKPAWDKTRPPARAGAMVDGTLIMTNRAPENGCMCWQFFQPRKAGFDPAVFFKFREDRERWMVQHYCTKLDLSRIGLADAPLVVYEDLEAVTNLLRMNHEMMVTCILELHIRMLLSKEERNYLPTGKVRTGRPAAHKKMASLQLDPNKHLIKLTDDVLLVPLGSRYEPWTTKAAQSLQDMESALWVELLTGVSDGYPELLLWQRRPRDLLPLWDYRRLPISGVDKRREVVYTGRSRAGG